MITLIEALNYRCLRYISQELNDFNILVGSNASGKSTFIDAISFISDIVNDGPMAAVEKRTFSDSYLDLLWMKKEAKIELAIEVKIPEEIKQKRIQIIENGAKDPKKKSQKFLKNQEDSYNDYCCRYELSIGLIDDKNIFGIYKENLWFKPPTQKPTRELYLFPEPESPKNLITKTKSGWKATIKRVYNDNYYNETLAKYNPSYLSDSQKSALGNLPPDEQAFPVASWFRKFITKGIQEIRLNSEAMRRPCRPGLPLTFLPDGSNLPWVIDHFKKNNKERYFDWIKHLQIVIPDMIDVEIIQREEDKHKYLQLCYRNKLKAPAWVVSDGTLRMLNLTILAYLSDTQGIYLIEEPENGIHPQAIETIYQSLSSVYDAQVFLATHSPVIVSIAKPKDLLCFSKTKDGTVDVINGEYHPRLKTWKKEVSLGTLFGSGVFG